MGVFDELDAQDPRRVPSDDNAVVPSKHNVFTQIEGDQQKFGPPPTSSMALFQQNAATKPPTLSSLVTGGTAVPDKYQQAAIAERDRLLKAGVPLPEGFTRRAGNAVGFGWGDELNAALMTPFEMARQGTFDPREGYKYAKARETLGDQAAAQNTGLAGDIAETGVGLAMMPGQVFAKPLAAAIGGGGKGVLPAAARIGAYGTESGVMGAIQGAGTAETVGDIPRNAAISGATGFLLGAPFGARADVARRTTALTPTEAELNKLGRVDYRARDRLPVSYDLERAVQQRLDDVAQAGRNRYGRDTPLTTETLTRKADEAARDVAAARSLNPNPPGTVAAGYSGAPNSWQAVATPRDIASLRREIFEEGSGKVSFDAAGRRVLNEVPSGTPTDVKAATVASKIIGRVVSRPEQALLANGVNLRDAVAAGLLDTRGRGNFGAAFRSKTVNDAVEKTLNSGAGGNFKNRLQSALNKAEQSGDFDGFSPAEKAKSIELIRNVAKSNFIADLGRKLSGSATGIGLSAAGGAGATYASTKDPWLSAGAGLAAVAGGHGLRYAGNRMALGQAERFAEMLRQRSPEYARRVAAAPTELGPGLTLRNRQGPGIPNVPLPNQVFPSALGAVRQGVTLGDQGAMRDALARMLLEQQNGGQ
jgi:hypothetical protein